MQYLAWYLFASTLSFALHVLDKLMSTQGLRRISERTLYATALVGGWPGGILAQQLFRHKTQQTQFLVIFMLTAMLNVAISLAIFMLIVRNN